MELHEIKSVLEESTTKRIGSGEFAEGYRAGIMFALNLLRFLDTSSKQTPKYNHDDDTYF